MPSLFAAKTCPAGRFTTHPSARTRSFCTAHARPHGLHVASPSATVGVLVGLFAPMFSAASAADVSMCCWTPAVGPIFALCAGVGRLACECSLSSINARGDVDAMTVEDKSWHDNADSSAAVEYTECDCVCSVCASRGDASVSAEEAASIHACDSRAVACCAAAASTDAAREITSSSGRCANCSSLHARDEGDTRALVYALIFEEPDPDRRDVVPEASLLTGVRVCVGGPEMSVSVAFCLRCLSGVVSVTEAARTWSVQLPLSLWLLLLLLLLLRGGEVRPRSPDSKSASVAIGMSGEGHVAATGRRCG
jgi:hypothetical protein